MLSGHQSTPTLLGDDLKLLSWQSIFYGEPPDWGPSCSHYQGIFGVRFPLAKTTHFGSIWIPIPNRWAEMCHKKMCKSSHIKPTTQGNTNCKPASLRLWHLRLEYRVFHMQVRCIQLWSDRIFSIQVSCNKDDNPYVHNVAPENLSSPCGCFQK